MKTVGFIGAGIMGRSMMKLFIDSGYGVIVYEKSDKVIRLLDGWDLEIAENIGFAALNADIIFLSLPGPVQVREVMTGPGGLLETPPLGRIVVDTTTSDPKITAQMYALAKQNGFSYADAPILGRPAGAGNWLFPVGGDYDDFLAVEPYLLVPGKKAIYIPGGPGSGHKLKLLNQLLFTVTNTITCEMMAIVQKSGLDPGVVYNAIRESGAATVSSLFCDVAGKIVEENYEPLFSLDLLRKDAALGIAMAKSFGAAPLIAELSQTMNEISSHQGLGAQDTSALVKVYQSLYAEKGI